MRSVTHLRGLGDIRTSVSTHARSASRHEGTPYLEITALGMERLRLMKEQAWMAKRQERIGRRVVELRKLMDRGLTQVQEKDLPHPSTPGAGGQPPVGHEPWRTLTVGY